MILLLNCTELRKKKKDHFDGNQSKDIIEKIVSILFFPLIKIVLPEKSWSFSVVSRCSATTELLSWTASSTRSKLAAFLRLCNSILKSLVFPILSEYSGLSASIVTVEQKTANFFRRSILQWQIKGFPCAHALATILKDGRNLYDYVEDYFTTNFYKSSYSYPIIPVPDIEKDEQSMSQKFVIEPPLTKRPPGRPKVKRLKSIGEETRPNKCSRCGDATRHNRKTCNAPI